MKSWLFHQPNVLRKALWYHLYIILIGIGPLLLALLSKFIGDCLRCQISEAGADKCIKLGIPFGDILNPLFMMGLLSIITIPLCVLATVVLIIIASHDTIYHKTNK